MANTRKKNPKKKTPLLHRSQLRVWMLIPVVVLVALVGYLVVRASFAASPPSHDRFVDISSPQCGVVKNLPIYSFGIVGLNGTYMAFGTNPCLAEQIRHFKSYDVYVGVNYPSRHCPSNITAYQCGRLAAQYNLNVIKNYDLQPQAIWIDVETGARIPWSTIENNRAYLRGMVDQLHSKYGVVRYYSNAGMWNKVVGNWGTSAYAWYATGATNSTDALRACSKRFGGGKTSYVQYTQNNLDYNRKCP